MIKELFQDRDDRFLNDGILGYADNYGINKKEDFWLPSADCENTWIQNKLDPRKSAYLDQQGWLDPTAISYRYNKHGFRDGKELDQEFDIVALGCSYTLGAGVPEMQTWPRLLETKSNKSVANLGVLGASAQTCFRLVYYWLHKLKPKIVAVLLPFSHRLEVIVSEDPGKFHIKRFLANQDFDKGGEYLKEYWSTNYNSLFNRKAYTLAIQNLCDEHGADLIVYPVEEFENKPWRDQARDFGHPGPLWHQNIAELFLEKIRHGQE